jgi:hypothetical protein
MASDYHDTLLGFQRALRGRSRPLIPAVNAGGGGTVTAEGGKPRNGVDGSAGVCELRCELDDLLEVEAMLRSCSPSGRFLLADLIPVADELARKRELELAERRGRERVEPVIDVGRQAAEQLTKRTCALFGLAPSAS